MNMLSRPKPRAAAHFAILSLSAAAFFSGCAKENTFQAPPPPKVTVAQPVQQDVTLYTSVPGRTAPVDAVEIRARVSGRLESKNFEPGTVVEAGSTLFTIERKHYETAVASAEAQVASAQASLDLTEARLKRSQKAAETGAISEIDLLIAQADRDSATAALDLAQAALADAALSLEYTEVTTPISGLASRERVSVGNLVGSNGQTLLTTVVQQEPLYLYFDINERLILPYLLNDENPNRERQEARKNRPAAIRIQLANGTVLEERAKLDYADNTVNPATGTIEVRAVFPNETQKMVPGLFVTVQLPRAVEAAVLVPERAVQRDLAGAYMLTVAADGTVERRGVVTGDKFQTLRIIQEGLSVDDVFVLDGVQRARPGGKVQTEQTAFEVPSADTPATETAE